jgi:hypothetical protein
MKIGLYKNKKNGDIYRVVGIGIDCTDDAGDNRDGGIMINYVSISGKGPFYREISNFKDKFEEHV